jgi:hypothetical protein
MIIDIQPKHFSFISKLVLMNVIVLFQRFYHYFCHNNNNSGLELTFKKTNSHECKQFN